MSKDSISRIKNKTEISGRSSPRFSLNRSFDLVMKGIGNQEEKSPKLASPLLSNRSRAPSILSRLGGPDQSKSFDTRRTDFSMNRDVTPVREPQINRSNNRTNISNLFSNTCQVSIGRDNDQRSERNSNYKSRDYEYSNRYKDNFISKNSKSSDRRANTRDQSPLRGERSSGKVVSILKNVTPVRISRYENDRKDVSSIRSFSGEDKDSNTAATPPYKPVSKIASDYSRITIAKPDNSLPYPRALQDNDKFNVKDDIHNVSTNILELPSENSIRDDEFRRTDIEESTTRVKKENTFRSVFDRLEVTNANGSPVSQKSQTFTKANDAPAQNGRISSQLPITARLGRLPRQTPLKFNKASADPYQKPAHLADRANNNLGVRTPHGKVLHRERINSTGSQGSDFSIQRPKRHPLLFKNISFQPLFTKSSALLPIFYNFYSTNSQLYKKSGYFPIGFFEGGSTQDIGNTNYLVDYPHTPQLKQPTQFPGPVPKSFQNLLMDVSRVRCSFFPGCNRPNCFYYHPVEECPRLDGCPGLPNKMCFYLHPSQYHIGQLCKYDEHCNREECLFMHLKRHFTVGSTLSFYATPCSMGSCLGPLCPYLHPNQKTFHDYTFCRAKTACTRNPCAYVHKLNYLQTPNITNQATAVPSTPASFFVPTDLPKAADSKSLMFELFDKFEQIE